MLLLLVPLRLAWVLLRGSVAASGGPTAWRWRRYSHAVWCGTYPLQFHASILTDCCWSINLQKNDPVIFYQKLRKEFSISYSKFQHDPTHSSACIAKKKNTQGGGAHRPPLSGRGLSIWSEKIVLKSYFVSISCPRYHPAANNMWWQMLREQKRSKLIGCLLHVLISLIKTRKRAYRISLFKFRISFDNILHILNTKPAEPLPVYRVLYKYSVKRVGGSWIPSRSVPDRARASRTN